MTNEQLIRRALELVRDGLRSGGIPAENFCMAVTRRDGWIGEAVTCGTVCCIAGWTHELLIEAGIALSASAARQMVDVFGTAQPLLAPFGYEAMRPTGPQAAAAIDHYLAGKEPWPRPRTQSVGV